mmetsp:Transcript_106084/g.342186  ORF Transcript_106084/g.342186 Transcript_106084/m.342186 type:complete len:202 (+) Transcript_106084:102-707(+)
MVPCSCEPKEVGPVAAAPDGAAACRPTGAVATPAGVGKSTDGELSRAVQDTVFRSSRVSLSMSMNVFLTVSLMSSTLSGLAALEPLGEFPRPQNASKRTWRPACAPGGAVGGGDVCSSSKTAGAAYGGGAGMCCGVGAPNRAVQDWVTRRASKGVFPTGSTSMNVFFTVYFSSPSSDKHKDTFLEPTEEEAASGEAMGVSE